MLLIGAVSSIALHSSMLSWLAASSMVALSLISGGVKFWARVGPANFVLSLISLVSIRYFCFLMLMLTETIKWSKMYPCDVALVILKLLLSCIKIRSKVFPLTCVGPNMCCSRPSAVMVSLKTTASVLVWSSMWTLKFPSSMLLWYWGSLLVSSSVMSSMNIPFVVLCFPFGSGWYFLIMCIGLFRMIYFHIAYSKVRVLPFSRSFMLLFLPHISAIPPPLVSPGLLCVDVS